MFSAQQHTSLVKMKDPLDLLIKSGGDHKCKYCSLSLALEPAHPMSCPSQCSCELLRVHLSSAFSCFMFLVHPWAAENPFVPQAFVLGVLLNGWEPALVPQIFTNPQ